MASSSPSPSLLARVGTIAWSVVRHVPTRGALWGAIGFGLALAVSFTSIALSVLTFGRGAWLMAQPPFVAVFAAIVTAGVAIFAAHGLQRGVARAALELARSFQLVRYLAERVLALVAARWGSLPGAAPAAELVRAAGATIERYARAEGGEEGPGLGGWVLRRARRMLVRAIGAPLLDRIAAAHPSDDRNALLARARDAVTEELEGRLAEVVMAPLDRQRNLMVIAYLLVGSLWFHIVVGLIALVGKLRG